MSGVLHTMNIEKDALPQVDETSEIVLNYRKEVIG